MKQTPTTTDIWIEHDGKPCPVPPDTRVRIKLRNGFECYWHKAGLVSWRHKGVDWPAWEPGATLVPYETEVVAYQLA